MRRRGRTLIIQDTYTPTWTDLTGLVQASAEESLAAQIVSTLDSQPVHKTDAASGSQYVEVLDALLAEENQRPLMSLNDVKQRADEPSQEFHTLLHDRFIDMEYDDARVSDKSHPTKSMGMLTEFSNNGL